MVKLPQFLQLSQKTIKEGKMQDVVVPKTVVKKLRWKLIYVVGN